VIAWSLDLKKLTVSSLLDARSPARRDSGARTGDAEPVFPTSAIALVLGALEWVWPLFGLV
jgi:hypothetical protein